MTIHNDGKTVYVDSKLMSAINSFKQIKEYAIHDQPFLKVYSDRNTILYTITEEEYNLVLEAAERQAYAIKEEVVFIHNGDTKTSDK